MNSVAIKKITFALFVALLQTAGAASAQQIHQIDLRQPFQIKGPNNQPLPDYEIIFAARPPLTQNSLTGHAFIVWRVIDSAGNATDKYTVGMYPPPGSLGIIPVKSQLLENLEKDYTSNASQILIVHVPEEVWTASQRVPVDPIYHVTFDDCTTYLKKVADAIGLRTAPLGWGPPHVPIFYMHALTSTLEQAVTLSGNGMTFSGNVYTAPGRLVSVSEGKLSYPAGNGPHGPYGAGTTAGRFINLRPVGRQVVTTPDGAKYTGEVSPFGQEGIWIFQRAHGDENGYFTYNQFGQLDGASLINVISLGMHFHVNFKNGHFVSGKVHADAINFDYDVSYDGTKFYQLPNAHSPAPTGAGAVSGATVPPPPNPGGISGSITPTDPDDGGD
jgi:hypothetical protein